MPPPPIIREQVASRHNRLSVQQVGRRIDLEVAGATFATWHPEHLLSGYSWDAVTAAALLSAAGPPATVCLLGLGGGTVTRQLRHLLPESELTGLEIDDAVVRLARRHLELDRQDIEVIVDDAYQWLHRTHRRFDVIADDAFLTGRNDVERPVRPTVRHLRVLARRLAPGGILAANYIITAPHHDTYRQALKSFCTIFADVAAVVPPRGYNRILVGGPALHLAAAAAYRDRLSRARDRGLWDSLRVERVT